MPQIFFGLIRVFSNGINEWEIFYRMACKTVIAQEYLNDSDISPINNNRGNLVGVIINEFIEDEEKFSMVANEAYTKAFNLLTKLKSIKFDEESNLDFNDLGQWLEKIYIHFSDPEKCINPVSGVKIIARLINSSNKKSVDDDVEEENDDDNK